jgi:deoxyribonuclease-4
MRLIGAHVSSAGGLDQAPLRLAHLGGNVLQIFSSSPRMWLAAMPASEVIEDFKKNCVKNDVKEVFIHAKYLVNLASDRQELIDKSILSLKHDLMVGEAIGATGVIVHLGSHQGRGFAAVQDQLISHIQKLLQDKNATCKLLIENSAGQQGKIATQLSEISLLLKAVNSRRLGWCLDTCHAFSAGYSCGEDSGNKLYQNDIVSEAKKLGILEKLRVIHLNDSRDDFDSGRDRHDNLGEGKMGKERLAAYVNHPGLRHLPLILEVPGFDNKGPDKKNLARLKNLASETLY